MKNGRNSNGASYNITLFKCIVTWDFLYRFISTEQGCSYQGNFFFYYFFKLFVIFYPDRILLPKAIVCKEKPKTGMNDHFEVMTKNWGFNCSKIRTVTHFSSIFRAFTDRGWRMSWLSVEQSLNLVLLCLNHVFHVWSWNSYFERFNLIQLIVFGKQQLKLIDLILIKLRILPLLQGLTMADDQTWSDQKYHWASL